MSTELFTLLMFGTLLLLITLGHPLAVTLAFVSIVFGQIGRASCRERV